MTPSCASTFPTAKPKSKHVRQRSISEKGYATCVAFFVVLETHTLSVLIQAFRLRPRPVTILAMSKLAPFLWFNDNAEEAAEFYLSVFPNARKLSEVRPPAADPSVRGKVVITSVELEGQELTLMNGGPAQQLTPAISFFVRCDSQQEIDHYWDKLVEGGKPMACGWLTDRFGLCWQIVPRNIGELIRHPKAMQAMMGMIKLDVPTLETAALAD